MRVVKPDQSGNTTLLILKLLEDRDLYGYEMMEELRRRSDNTFHLKAGTLYPLLHSLELQGCLRAYEGKGENGKTRRYYHLTVRGHALLQEKMADWRAYTRAVDLVLEGERNHA